MSLVIIKVDREKRTHSVYCDGRSGNMVMEKANKISKYNIQDHSILAGTTGYHDFNVYFRMHFEEIVIQERLFDHLDDNELTATKLADIGAVIWRNFCKKMHLPVKKNSYDVFGAVISIDGNLFALDGNVVDDIFIFTAHETERDFVVSGADDNAALCLLDVGINIQTIFETISKYNYYVNDNITSIEDVMF